MPETAAFVITLAEMDDDGSGTGRLWYLPEQQWRQIEALLPEPDESYLYTPEDTDRAQAFRDTLLLVTRDE